MDALCTPRKGEGSYGCAGCVAEQKGQVYGHHPATRMSRNDAQLRQLVVANYNNGMRAPQLSLRTTT